MLTKIVKKKIRSVLPKMQFPSI